MRIIIITCCLLLTMQCWGASAASDTTVDFATTVAEQVPADSDRAGTVVALQAFIRDQIAEKPTDYG